MMWHKCHIQYGQLDVPEPVHNKDRLVLSVKWIKGSIADQFIDVQI